MKFSASAYANEMELELNDYSSFWFQIKECRNHIQTFLKYEEITDLNNTVLQFLSL